jgi:hypothetical protein
MFVQTPQGAGRWDNPSLYLVRYFALSPEAAIGETFGNFPIWSPAMLRRPDLPDSERKIGVYQIDEEVNPLLDLDNAANLFHRHIKPTDVVRRNRPVTQKIAADIFNEDKWAGIQWWSFHRPHWPVVAVWVADNVTFLSVEGILTHNAYEDAAKTLCKVREES